MMLLAHTNYGIFSKYGLYLLVLCIPSETLAFTPVVIRHHSTSHHEYKYLSHKNKRSENVSLSSTSETKSESTSPSSLPSSSTTTTQSAVVPSFLTTDKNLEEPPLHESTYTQVLSTTSLTPIAKKLRRAYDNHFQDPRQPNGDRFAWDPWFVSAGDGKQQQKSVGENDDNSDEDDDDDDEEEEAILIKRTTVNGEEEALANQIQYSLKRIQTSLFFPEDLYNDLVDDLVTVANSIGLTAISPPWTSMYTEGDTQNFHTDSSHGPMAFVLSLSNDDDFQGGETMILKPEILDLWRNFETDKPREIGNIVRYIPATLGRCIAFDPRVPHGVNRVTGTNQDPRRARVVIHGWFNEPEVCWFGAWEDTETAAATTLDESLQPLVETIGSGEIGRVVGYLAARVEIDETGSVDRVFAVCDTIQADMEDFRGVIGYDDADRPIMEDAVADVRLNVFETLKNLQFEEGADGRAIVVPFAFE